MSEHSQRERCTCGAEFELRNDGWPSFDDDSREWRDRHAGGCNAMMWQCEADSASRHFDPEAAKIRKEIADQAARSLTNVVWNPGSSYDPDS